MCNVCQCIGGSFWRPQCVNMCVCVCVCVCVGWSKGTPNIGTNKTDPAFMKNTVEMRTSILIWPKYNKRCCGKTFGFYILTQFYPLASWSSSAFKKMRSNNTYTHIGTPPVSKSHTESACQTSLSPSFRMKSDCQHHLDCGHGNLNIKKLKEHL